MQRRVDVAAQELGRQRQAHGDEALHVAGAATVETRAVGRDSERIGVPGLTIHGHHVGVAGQADAGAVPGSEGGKQVGLLSGLVHDQLRVHTERVQIIANVVNELEVRVAAGRVERNQPLDHLHAGGAGLQGALSRL